MPLSIAFRVTGEPVGQPRVAVRVLSPGGPGRRAITQAYYPDPKGKVRAWTRRIVAASMACHAKPREPLVGPLCLFAEFYMPRPQYLLKPKCPDGLMPHDQKPDLSNLIKLLEDVLEKEGWFPNDKAICSYGGSGKWYAARGEAPGCQVRITVLDADAGPGLFDEAT